MSSNKLNNRRFRDVRRILIRHAANRQVIHYSDLAGQLGLPTTGNGLGAALSPYLYALIEWCRTRNLPPLTALVVRKSGQDEGLPGLGFWQSMGFDDTACSDQEFKRSQLEEYRNILARFWGTDILDENEDTLHWTEIPQPAGRGRRVFINTELGQRVRLTESGVVIQATREVE